MRRDYGPDVLAEGAGRRRRAEYPQVPAERGLVVEEAGGGFCGAVVECEKQVVTLEDRVGRQRVFPLTRGGFLLEGRPVTLVRPGQPRPAAATRTASGSVAAPRPAAGTAARARVARASRIYVEGRIEYRTWEDREKQTRYTTEIIAREVMLLSPKGSSEGGGDFARAKAPAKAGADATKGESLDGFPEALDEEDDDLPF